MACKYLHRSCYLRFVNIPLGTIKNFSTEQAVIPVLDEAVKEGIESNTIKPRKHPGVFKIPTCTLPDKITEAIRIISDDHPVKTILNDAKMLSNYLYSRHYPWEEEDLEERRSNFVKDVKSRLGELPQDASEEYARHYSGLVQASVTKLMTKYNYRWTALDLHDYSCLVYIFTRAAPNYAAVIRVFHEIMKTCPDYKPTSLLDFGSGVGSVSWAAKTCWGDHLKEFVNIDSSSSMHELASLVLCGGNKEVVPPASVFYKGFLPAKDTKHSVVVTAHSLMELPSQESRLNTLLSLWHKTKDFLIIIEQGTKPGFKLVVEARDFILSLEDEKSTGHIFAPCPHDSPCPRSLRGPYPCHFQVLYSDLAVAKKQEIKKELFSYVIIKKGKREKETHWPRVVRPVLQRHNHVICRMCTDQGDLREIIFTKKHHGKVLYKCAKKTNWGDLLPVNLPTVTSDNSQENSQQIQSDSQEPG